MKVIFMVIPLTTLRTLVWNWVKMIWDLATLRWRAFHPHSHCASISRVAIAVWCSLLTFGDRYIIVNEAWVPQFI